VSGNANPADILRVNSGLQQSDSVCNSNGGSGTQMNPGPQDIGPGDYSKEYEFHPFSSGTYLICAYLTSGGSQSATVQVAQELPAPSAGPMRYSSGVGATLEGGVDPRGADANWHFEYGTDLGYGQSAGSGTVSPGDNGAVSAVIGGLTPGTTYHYRLVASNPGGSAATADKTFTTAPASTLTLSAPPDRKVDEKWPVSASGFAGGQWKLRLVIEPNGSSCAAQIADELGRPGAFEPPFQANPQLGGGSYSMAFTVSPGGYTSAQPSPGNYLLCGYVVSQSHPGYLDDRDTTEAAASTFVTVTQYACPSIDMTLTPGPTPTNADFDRGVQKITLTVDLPDDAAGGYIEVGSSDGAVQDELDVQTLTRGGRYVVNGYFDYEETIRASYHREVTVTFTVTYSPDYPRQKCVKPDGTIYDASTGSRVAKRKHTATFRNHGTPPDGEGGGEGNGSPAEIVGATLATALAPNGAAAKIGAILKAGAYPAKAKAPGAGKLQVGWYFLPKGARLPKGAHTAGTPKPVLLASGSKTVTKAGKTVLEVKLSKKGKAKLKKAKKIKLTAKGSFTPKGGKKLTTKKAFSLKR
jgi:hypothetical protein